jgi:hypothetical protein
VNQQPHIVGLEQGDSLAFTKICALEKQRTSRAPRQIDIFDAWTTKNDFPFRLAARNYLAPQARKACAKACAKVHVCRGEQ